MNLSKNFTLEELTVSDYGERHGLKNEPSVDEIEALRQLCVNVLQPLRDRLGKPVIVNSAYRSLLVNRGIGSNDDSQHVRGEAADIRVNGMTAGELFHFIIDSAIPFDQIIEEYGRWVHISYAPVLRRDKRLARFEDGKTVYHRAA